MGEKPIVVVVGDPQGKTSKVKSRLGWYKRAKECLLTFEGLILAFCLFTFCWIVVTTFSTPPVGQLQIVGSHVFICPRKTICATNWYSLLLLGFSRTSAYGMIGAHTRPLPLPEHGRQSHRAGALL